MATALKIFGCVISLYLCSVTTAAPWVLNKEENGVKVFVRDTPNSAFRAFKGVTTFPVNLSAVVAALDDVKAYPKYLHQFKSAKVLRKISDTESIRYIVTNMPWPVKDRDVVIHSRLNQNPQSKQVIISLNGEPKTAKQQVGLVRIQKMQGRWVLTPQGKNSVTVAYEMSVDPGGNIPKWLVNTLSVDIPFYTLSNLRKLVQQPIYRQAKLSYITE